HYFVLTSSVTLLDLHSFPTRRSSDLYTFYGDNSGGTINGGAGINFWFTEKIALTLRSTYKHSLEDIRRDHPEHFQHFVGITIKFGGKDTDGDGIYDPQDDCPDEPGTIE